MSADLGIRAAVRAAVEQDSERWTTHLAGYWETSSERWRQSPHCACLRNQPVSGDERDGWSMRAWTERPALRTLGFAA